MGTERADELDALTRFCVGNPQLDELTQLIGGFNLFEAAGLVRDEIKHSKFLSFLLNPNEAHGLGAKFLVGFLQSAIESVDPQRLPVTPLELELWNLADTEVRVEWSNIDVLLLNHTHRLAVIIENKVGTSEHSDQLSRYQAFVEHQFEGWTMLCLFLSPEGITPTDERYIPVTYESVAQLLTILGHDEGIGSPSVRMALGHYETLLRRYVLNDTKLRELCEQIYRKHQRALDLIYQYRPQRDSLAWGIVVPFIRSFPGVTLSNPEKSGSSEFLPTEWLDWVPRSDELWFGQNWQLMFGFSVGDRGIRLNLNIGPGSRETAQRILDVAHQHKPPFHPQSRQANKKWNIVYRRILVAPQLLESSDIERIAAELETSWSSAWAEDLPAMAQVLRGCLDQEGSVAPNSSMS